jgi:hypothetical protein
MFQRQYRQNSESARSLSSSTPCHPKPANSIVTTSPNHLDVPLSVGNGRIDRAARQAQRHGNLAWHCSGDGHELLVANTAVMAQAVE